MDLAELGVFTRPGVEQLRPRLDRTAGLRSEKKLKKIGKSAQPLSVSRDFDRLAKLALHRSRWVPSKVARAGGELWRLAVVGGELGITDDTVLGGNRIMDDPVPGGEWRIRSTGAFLTAQLAQEASQKAHHSS
jgi:hypothetical protein